MNSTFSDILDESLLVYLDKLLVFSLDIDSHYADIKKILLWLHKHVLKAKGSKCVFSVMKVEYIGHLVSNGTVAMDPEKVHAVAS